MRALYHFFETTNLFEIPLPKRLYGQVLPKLVLQFHFTSAKYDLTGTLRVAPPLEARHLGKSQFC